MDYIYQAFLMHMTFNVCGIAKLLACIGIDPPSPVPPSTLHLD